MLPRYYRLGTWGVYTAAVLVFAAVLIQNRKLKATLAQLVRRPTASSPVGLSSPGARFLRDDSIRRLVLLDQQGEANTATELIDRGFRYFYFFREGCLACEELIRGWADYLAMHGPDRLVFGSLGPVSNEYRARFSPAPRFFKVRLDDLSKQRLGRLPQILVVNEWGVVTETCASVADLDALIRTGSVP